ncbi:MAG: 16S rRNA (cytosine(967)-C(5))-methyltransferase RsmB [Oscillospiraceae bacterium]
MTPRQAALRALQHVQQEGAYSTLELDAVLRLAGFSGRDKAFTSTLFYGTLERRLTLDFCISLCANRELDTLDPTVREILRLGAYQLLFLQGVPARAAISESVNLARQSGMGRAAGFINAVLRRLSQLGDIPYPNREKKPESYLSVRYSCPKWLAKYLCKTYGEALAEEILSSFLGAPPVYLRVNSQKTTPQKLIRLLELQGLDAAETPVPGALRLEHTAALTQSPLFAEGLFHVQDLSSQLCALALGAQKGMRVLDVCAAPGGKSFTIAQMMEDTGEVCSCDLHEHRVQLIRQGARRLSLSCIVPMVRDAREPWERQFDRVLCDVPCSGLGVVRRKPEIKYQSRQACQELPALQLSILQNAAGAVKPGGVLVYSTCTLCKEENEGVVGEFLQKNKEFEIEKLPKILYDYGIGSSWVTMLPNSQGPDGFFVCRMKKIGE